MKKLSLLLLLMLGLLLNGYGQTENASNTIGEVLLSDEALITSIQKVNAYTVEDAASQLKYHLSYVIGDRAASIPDFRKVFFSVQCKDAMTAIVQEFDNSGLTAELLRVAPDFLASYTYDEGFTEKLVTTFESYHINQVQITTALPTVVEAQTRFQSTLHLPITGHLNEGMMPLMEKCMNGNNSEVTTNEEGPVVHPFTIGAHTSQKGYSAGGVLMAHSLTDMITATKTKDTAQLTQAIATLLAVWVNLPDEMSF